MFNRSPSAAVDRTPLSFVLILLASLLAACIPTVAPAIDMAIASFLKGMATTSAPAAWWWVEWINVNIPSVFRALLAVGFAAWLVATFTRKWRHWRLPLAFFVVAGIFGPGLVVNGVFKDNWQRARPYQVENFGGAQQFTRAAVPTNQCKINCSFVSGHVACGFLLTTLLLVSKKRLVWALAGTAAGLTIGFARMANMDHWLSDVLWAYPITLLSSWLAWRLLLRFYPTDGLHLEQVDQPATCAGPSA
jgi:lipid A 4'-phosphatase